MYRHFTTQASFLLPQIDLRYNRKCRRASMERCVAMNQHIIDERRSRRKQSPKKRKVQYVPWAGKGGMLPHQYYSGVLNHEEYKHWLQIPLDTNATMPTTNIQNYFSAATSSNASSMRIDPPQVQPRHLRPIYIDDHITVVGKPSGVLSVPGPRRHECVASLAYRYFGKSHSGTSHVCNADDSDVVDNGHDKEADTWQPFTAADSKQIDTSVVHRLDRDTSGVLMFARNDDALKRLHEAFKDKSKKKVSKRYVAVVCGHWNAQADSSVSKVGVNEGEIDLPLVRDLERPPFMRVATVETRLQQEELKQQSLLKDQNLSSEEDKDGKNQQKRRHQHAGYLRMVGKEAKASMTTYRILSYEYLVDTIQESNGINITTQLLPVTRVELQPITGRTHQLRVHCAAVGHPIVGDSIYGYEGEGSPNGGLMLDESTIGASLDLQKKIYKYWIRRQQEQRTADNAQEVENCMLCLHAYQLSVFHPLTESPMTFECPAPF